MIGGLLRLHEEDARSDGVRGSARHQNAVTRSHRHPVHQCQHRLSILRLHQLGEPVLADLLAPPDPHRGVVVGFQDVPCLGLAVGAAEVLRGVLAAGMHVHGQALTGIQELHEHTGVARFSVIAAEPAAGVGANRVTQQRAVGQPGGPEVRLTEAGDRRADPLLR